MQESLKKDTGKLQERFKKDTGQIQEEYRKSPVLFGKYKIED